MKTRGSVEVFIQERGARARRYVQKYPADQVPKVGAKFSVENRNFVVMEKKTLLTKRGKTAAHGVLLVVEDFDALSW